MHSETAAPSSTLSWSRSRSAYSEPVVATGAGDRHRVRIVNPVDLGGLHEDLGADLDRAQRRRRVGREIRVAGAGHEDHDAALLEVAHGAPPDVRLGDLVHRDRAHDPGRDAGPLEGVLEGEAVHHRGEHADVVAGRAIHALGRRRQAPEDVAAADHDADLDATGVDGRDLLGDEGADLGIDAVLARPEQGLAGQLEQDAPVAGRVLAHLSSPSA